jgi:hypothetical protein
MSQNSDCLKERLRQWTLVLGVGQITVGCLVGLIPPPAVAWFRGIVMAHVAFTANGVLMIVLGLLVRELRLGASGLKTWFASLQVGTWMNGIAGLLAAFLGASSNFMPMANNQAPPPGGADSYLVSAGLVLCAAAILTALAFTLYGLLRRGPSDAQEV